MANIDRIFIEVPMFPGSEQMVVVSVSDATDEQFDWWIKSWVATEQIEIEFEPDINGWLRSERSSIIDWMRKEAGIPISELPPGTNLNKE